MQPSMTETATNIFLGLLKQWPETSPEDHVTEAVKLAEKIHSMTDETAIRAKLHNLQMDYDSLKAKYISLQIRLSDGAK